MSKYGLAFDTNFIRAGGENVSADKVFNGVIEEVNDFLLKNKVTSVNLYLPDIALREMLAQRNDQINKYIDVIEKGFKELSVFEVELPSTDYKEKDYPVLLKEQSVAYLSDNKVLVINPPENALEEITERALRHEKPFRAEGDKGMKDTLLWLSLIEHFSSSAEDTCVLLSANTGDFNESLSEEFETRTGKKIIFLKTTQDLKEYLDKELPLNLHLKKLHESIKDEIKRKAGDIVLYLNENCVQNSSDLYSSFFGNRTTQTYNRPVVWRQQHVVMDLNDSYSGDTLLKKELVGYSFKNLSINDIKSINKDTYEVDIDISVDEKYKDDAPNSQYFSRVFKASLWDKKSTSFLVTLVYNKPKNEITITSCRKGFSW